jgi:hypothetical protein
MKRKLVVAATGIFVLLIVLAFISMWTLRLEYESPPHSASISLPSTSPGESPVDRVLGQLNLGNIAFNAPRTMEMEKAQNVQLVLSLEQSIEELKASIQALGTKEGARISVSDRMQASLSGLAFDIVAITPDEQAIASKGITSWQWEVVPKKEGSQRLYLSLTALFDVNGKDTKRSIKTFEKVIEVEVTPFQRARLFISGNWQWLWATFIAPVGFWLWKRRNNVRGSAS